MNNPYPNAPYPMQNPAVQQAKDESDLKTLSLLHYVWSALLGCGSLAFVAYFIGIGAFVASQPAKRAADVQGQQAAAAITIGIGIVVGIFCVVLFVLHLLAAAGIKKRTRYMLVMIMSGMACLHFPLGTGLGVWTIMVLGRPSVKSLFGRV